MGDREESCQKRFQLTTVQEKIFHQPNFLNLIAVTGISFLVSGRRVVCQYTS